MNVIKKCLIFLWILLIPFQDSGLQGLPIGFLGASPSFIPLFCLLLLNFVERIIIIDRRYVIDKKYFFVISAVFSYMLVITIINLLVFGDYSHGVSLYIKSLNLFVMTILFVFPIFFINYNTKRMIKNATYIALFLTVIGIIICDIIHMDFFVSSPLFHFYANSNMRPRGFTLESSWLSAMIITLSLLSAHFVKNIFVKTFFVILMMIMLLYSGSKGGIITLTAIGLVMLLFNFKMKILLKIPLIIIVVVVLYFLYGVLSEVFVTDISEYTSTATRIGLVTTSIIVVTNNPLGVGFSGFLPAIDEYVPRAVSFLDSLIGVSMNWKEILSYVGSNTALMISTKTLLFDYFAYFGIPFLFLFIKFHYDLLTKLNQQGNMILCFAVAYAGIALSTYISGLGFYNISLVYGVAFYEVYGKERINSCT